MNFPHAPPGKDYVVDAGFTNMRGFLALYRNVRYWLSDFRGGGHPRDRKEQFNYVHSSLRNVIERSFGVLKARFPILKRMPPYPFPVQRSIVVAAMTVHNFIIKEAIADALFQQYENENISLEASNDDDNGISDTDTVVDIVEQMEMSEVRDAIADALFQS
eukprot:TRINITY_DN620_c0_g1_i1.p1 TRINITY_DN620_c0_g1~~TRINITY_DN620_c0_g1_i1.p1  ORF type:complete len:161 (-),score=16.88 TRINITY_DN620_c0_g1_i1:862-1344(-)